jgi:hypothetical protein
MLAGMRRRWLAALGALGLVLTTMGCDDEPPRPRDGGTRPTDAARDGRDGGGAAGMGGAGGGGAGGSDGGGSGGTSPDAKPTDGAPDPGAPDATRPDAALPDTRAPDGPAPGTPDTRLPDPRPPDTRPPDPPPMTPDAPVAPPPDAPPPPPPPDAEPPPPPDTRVDPPPPDAAPDTAPPEPDAAPDTAGPPGEFLDRCFSGLRMLRSSSQIATKRSADGSVHMRIALERIDFGTSGTIGWAPVRLAVQTPTDGFCITDEPLLRDGYTLSHHNCADVLSVSTGARQIVILRPDTRLLDPARTVAELSLFAGSSLLLGPLALDLLTCTTATGAICTSGGPCGP